MSKFTTTTRDESAVRLYLYMDGKISPSVLYAVAYPGSIDAVEALVDLPAVASRWWRSKKIQDFYFAEKAVYEAKKDAERKKIESEVMTRINASKGDIHPHGLTDYTDPRNIRTKLNQLINAAKAPGEVLDAMKLLLARQNEIAPEKNGAQVRAYVPITCSDCPLYAAAKAKIEKQ